MLILSLFGLSLLEATTCDVIQFDASLSQVVDPRAKVVLLAQQNISFAHGGGVYIPATKDFYVESNFFIDPVTGARTIREYKLNLDTDVVSEVVPELPILEASGASLYSDHQILICSQGLNDTAGALVLLDTRTLVSTRLIFSAALNLNSPNDVYVSSMYNGFFFTDPWYGSKIGYRPPPTLDQNIYYVNRTTMNVHSLNTFPATSRPNGIVHSVDGKTLYVSDSGFRPGTGTSPNVTRSVYSFDLALDGTGVPRVTNKQTFVENVDNGIPDTVRVDELGNVYVAVQDGVAIYSPKGLYMGKLAIPTAGPVASFGWADKKLIILSETFVYAVDLKVGSGPTGFGTQQPSYRDARGNFAVRHRQSECHSDTVRKASSF